MAETKTERQTYASDFIKSDTDQAVFLGNAVLDNMMTAMIALGSEVWANRRRMKIIESLLEQNGAVTAEMIEAYMPSEKEDAEWQAERDRFINDTFAVFGQDGGGLTLSSDRRN